MLSSHCVSSHCVCRCQTHAALTPRAAHLAAHELGDVAVHVDVADQLAQAVKHRGDAGAVPERVACAHGRVQGGRPRGRVSTEAETLVSFGLSPSMSRRTSVTAVGARPQAVHGSPATAVGARLQAVHGSPVTAVGARPQAVRGSPVTAVGAKHKQCTPGSRYALALLSHTAMLSPPCTWGCPGLLTPPAPSFPHALLE